MCHAIQNDTSTVESGSPRPCILCFVGAALGAVEAARGNAATFCSVMLLSQLYELILRQQDREAVRCDAAHPL
jgi:hypothetical protein